MQQAACSCGACVKAGQELAKLAEAEGGELPGFMRVCAVLLDAGSGAMRGPPIPVLPASH